MAIKFKRIADLRIDNDLFQKEVAEALKVNKNTYPHWESGLYEIPLDIIDKLSLFYNVSIDYITGLSDDKNKSYKKLNYDLLSKRIKEIRRENHLSQTQINYKIKEITQMNISRYENGITPIPFSKLYLFAREFDVSIDYLMGKTNEKNIKKKQTI